MAMENVGSGRPAACAPDHPRQVAALLAEGWLNRVLNSPDERAELRTGKRYMSNTTIVKRAS